MMDRSEDRSVSKRKGKARLVNHAYHFMRIFPIDRKKIVFTAFEGDGGYCCNPRYIAQELLDRNRGYKLIWLVNDTDRKFPKGIKKVKNTFVNRVFHLTTAKAWVDNSRKEYGTAKRRGQMYMQTWHAAIEFKAVGGFREELFPRIAYLVSRYDSKLADVVLSDSEWCTKRYPKMLLYDGKILKTGSPRCDVLINDRDKTYREIRQRYGISQDARIVMFAPTFRGGGQKGKRKVFVEETGLDFRRLMNALERKFGGAWHIFMRLHPQLSAKLEQMPLKDKPNHMVDVSKADDMNELIAASDVLVTDYSSAAFDAANIMMPVFLYAEDLEEYIRERGRFMWNMRKLPFPLAETNEELEANILEFDECRYREKLGHFLEKCGVLEDGHASERAADVIEKHMLRN